jgi:hypothetical protein
MKVKKLSLVALSLTAALTLSACKSTDVVGKVAVTSFEAVLDVSKDKVSSNDAANSWTLQSPAGENFSWSKDFSSDKPDASVDFDAAPFIKAGLDVSKLPSDKYVYDQTTGRITMPYELSQDKFTYSGEATPIDSFKKIVETNRKAIGYHEVLDHYGVGLGNGNMFEWAKDMSTNDKDIVFVLNPQPFIDAGVDPSKVTEWVFAKVEITDENNNKKQVDKFLKPYNLK